MSDVYCKAPWTGISYMPGGKFAPCCAWHGDFFDSPQQVTEIVGKEFLKGNVPDACKTACPKNQQSWRNEFDKFETDFKSQQIHFLDFRNNNLCNMKCRSCNPGFSTAWASEAKGKTILLHESTSVDDIDLSHCKKVYFAGGEPLINLQHYQILEKLIAQKSFPVLMYSTNLSMLSYKDKHVGELWKHFERVNVHASIDAVGEYAEVVRSGTVWNDVHNNLQWLRTQPNALIRIATVISAINIWFLPSLLEYIDWIDYPHLFEPVVTNDSVFDLSSIPPQYRNELIDMLSNSRFKDHINMRRAIDILQQNNYNELNWHKFLSQQLILDQCRNENWFKLFPHRHQTYKEVLKIWTS